MKIEPTLYRFRNSEQVIIAMPGYTPPSADWGKLYTEAQMLQLGEACAALVDELDCGRFGDAVAIRELIKEMMG